MAQGEQGRSRDRSLVGVYETEEEAEQAAEKAQQAGASEGDVRMGSDEDEVVSLQAEMQEEMDQSWVSPQAGFAYTKESAKGLATVMPVFSVAGAVLALPLALIEFGGLDLWVRIVISALVGATAGVTVALVVGPSLGAKSPSAPMAAQRGRVVRVEDDSPEVSGAMADSEPIRVDELREDGTRAATVTTEEQRSDEGTAQRLTRNVRARDR